MSAISGRMSTKAATRWVVVLTAIGSLMAALDTLVVSTALSTIRLDLGASVETAREEAFLAHGVTVLALDGAQIAQMNSFLTPEAFERFGLPAEIGA